MNTVTETLPNGNTITFKIVNGTAYHEKTCDAVIRILEEARNNRNIRIRFCLGDTETGRDWGEIHDVCGYVGRSTGSIKIPLLIAKINSCGGGGILDDCIIRIEKKMRINDSYHEVYRHPNYHKETIV